MNLWGAVKDVDDKCGDGIAWTIVLRAGGKGTELAAGEFPNGGAQKFGKGDGMPQLDGIEVREGDFLELHILPKW